MMGAGILYLSLGMTLITHPQLTLKLRTAQIYLYTSSVHTLNDMVDFIY
jgi:hypothetical protein